MSEEKSMYERIGCGLALSFLGVLAVYDIRYKRIPILWIAVAGMVAITFFAAGNGNGADQAMSCIFPGLLLLLLAFVTGEQIGYGDGLTVLVLGFFLGGGFCIMVIILGVMMTGPFSVYRFMRKSREPVPLIPFLLAAMEVILIYA